MISALQLGVSTTITVFGLDSLIDGSQMISKNTSGGSLSASLLSSLGICCTV
jgi:hypothetical protein